MSLVVLFVRIRMNTLVTMITNIIKIILNLQDKCQFFVGTLFVNERYEIIEQTNRIDQINLPNIKFKQ